VEGHSVGKMSLESGIDKGKTVEMRKWEKKKTNKLATPKNHETL
jgi:hypothetical protein